MVTESVGGGEKQHRNRIKLASTSKIMYFSYTGVIIELLENSGVSLSGDEISSYEFEIVSSIEVEFEAEYIMKPELSKFSWLNLNGIGVTIL